MSASKSRRSNRSPRRKAGRTAARKTKRAINFRLTVEGQEMVVSYTQRFSSYAGRLMLFEFRSPYEPARRIPVSETGYWSHFAAMHEVASAGGPKEYARELVLESLNRTRKAIKLDGEQLSLL